MKVRGGPEADMMRWAVVGLFTLVLSVLSLSLLAEAEQTTVYRVGVIHAGGPYYATIEGLRDGLRELGLEEGKHFVLEIRDTKGDLKAVEAVARTSTRSSRAPGPPTCPWSSRPSSSWSST
jgi:ABC-type uncharacterized transport system substrate-binding protein